MVVGKKSNGTKFAMTLVLILTSPSDEAFVLLLLENRWDNWEANTSLTQTVIANGLLPSTWLKEEEEE